jgi:non-ribosomal peptide synthetase component E (peptide arylation enzyme)
MTTLLAVSLIALSIVFGIAAGLILVAFLDDMSDLVTRWRGKNGNSLYNSEEN